MGNSQFSTNSNIETKFPNASANDDKKYMFWVEKLML